MNADPKKELNATSKEEPQEPLKRFTKEDLRKFIPATPQEEPKQTLADPPTKAVLATLLESDRNANKLDQPFPRSFAATPCKPPCEPQPKAKLMTVLLVVVFFVGVGVYFVIQRHLDKNKPHETPKNMPMRMIGGLKSPQE